MTYLCLHDRAPQYLADRLIPASDAAPRRLRMLARQFGTRCQMNLEFLTVLMALNDS